MNTHLRLNKYSFDFAKWILVSALILTGCATYQSEGLLSVDSRQSFPYKHAAISTDTDNKVQNTVATVLKSKGFTVYRMTSFRKVLSIKPGNNVLVFECKDAGITDRSLGGWSQAVECLAFDLHSEEIIYEGAGEYMGLTAAGDFMGATKKALINIPSVGKRGTITSMIDLPHDNKFSSKKYKRSKDGSVSQGTAWLMSGGYVVTNYHVVEGASTIKLLTADGKKLEAKVYRTDRINDIALLKVESNVDLPSAIPISSKSARLGSDVFTLGFPIVGIMGMEIKFTSGKINSLSGIQNDPRVYQISVPVQSGNSGGPLINNNGEVVGIVTSKLRAVEVFKWTGDLPQNVNYAIKSHYIAPLLTEKSDGSVKVLIPSSGTFEELVERVKNSIFMVIAE